MEISSHQSHLLQQLNEQRQQDLFCDCSILVEGKVFKAHCNVLFASSGYFKMLLSQCSKEAGQPTTATFQAFSPETFSVILDFVYSGKLSLTGQNVIEVMSAASFLQMTDVISVCKTFIKSSLDISEKEKDRYFSLSDKEVSSNGVERLCLYSASWRAESSPPRSHLSPDRGTCVVNSNSWTNFSYYPSGPRATQPLSKHDQRQESLRKGRHLGLAQPADAPYKANKLEDRAAAEQTSHAPPPSEEELQVDSEGDSCPASYQYGQGSDAVTRGLAVPQHEHELPHSASKSKPSKAEEPYPSMPSVLGVMGNWAEGKSLGAALPSLRRQKPQAFAAQSGVGDKRETGIHQACKPICRKCKRHVTEMTGQVVQEGTRRYRLCNECLSEAGIDSIRIDLDTEPPPEFPLEEDKDSNWNYSEDNRSDVEIVEDGSSDLVIQQVDDSDDEAEEKDVKPNIR
ncbi:hypothetical protein E2320_000276 [Naja naja]|nr:hypothetical protein E2320_000276 [Naja naja]